MDGSMLEAFVWMFKAKNFKQYYFKLFFISIALFVIGVISVYPMTILGTMAGVVLPVLTIVIFAFTVFLACSSVLFIQGYMWELTEQIINRKTDIKASSVYNGKVKEIFTVELPEWSTARFIWRGFASVVATIIMFIPWIALLWFALSANDVLCAKFDLIKLIESTSFVGIPVLILIILFHLLFPGLLWNYAKQNSILSTLNISKAVFIFGNYTGRYILNLIKIWFLYIADFAVNIMLCKLFKIGEIIGSDNLVLPVILLVLFGIIMLCKWLYYVHVYAYLIGTLTSADEN